MSLARLPWVGWFVVLFSAYFVITIFDTHTAKLLPAMDPHLFGLLGIVTGSAVASNLIVDSKKQPTGSSQPNGTIDRNDTPGEASWADLYLGEESPIAGRSMSAACGSWC